MNYSQQQIITTATGNNSISFDARKKLLNQEPTLTIPSLSTISSIEEIKLGNFTVFEEIDHEGKLQRCTGLQHIYQFQHSKGNKRNIYIMDNHNHALYFRLRFLQEETPSQVIHIDAHADLGDNTNHFNKDNITNESYIWKFVNHRCTIGNFITPFLPLAAVKQVRTSHTLEEVSQQNRSNTLLILDIDLDFRALDQRIPDYHITMLRALIEQAQLVTIATSPFFLDQDKAGRFLEQIFT